MFGLRRGRELNVKAMNGALLGLVSLLCVSASGAQPPPAGPCAGEVAEREMVHALYTERRAEGDFQAR